MRKALVLAVAVAHLLLLDAVTKEISVATLKGGPSVHVIPGFLSLTYVENRGCAWGMFQGSVWPLAAFAIAVMALLVWKRREFFGLGEKDWRGRLGAVSECLLYAGILGNLIDRVFRGCVIDFIDFHWGDAWHFPCFNVADICITVAAGALVVASLFPRERRRG
jgi:signal peptidase II